MSDYGLVAPTRETILNKDIQQQGFVDIQDTFTESERECILNTIVKNLNKYSVKLSDDKNEYYGTSFRIVGTDPIYLSDSDTNRTNGCPIIIVPTPNLGKIRYILIGVEYYTPAYPLRITVLILMDKNSEVK